MDRAVRTAASQSARRAACDPSDQSSSTAGSEPTVRRLAFCFLARGDHPGPLCLALGDPPVRAARQQLLQRLLVDLLVQRHLDALGWRRGRRGRGREQARAGAGACGGAGAAGASAAAGAAAAGGAGAAAGAADAAGAGQGRPRRRPAVAPPSAPPASRRPAVAGSRGPATPGRLGPPWPGPRPSRTSVRTACTRRSRARGGEGRDPG